MTAGQAAWVAGNLAVLAVVLAALREPGPSPVEVLARRYGPGAFAAGLVWLLVAAGVLVAPAFTLAVAAVVVAVVVAAGVRWGWTASTAVRAVRRCVLRARWTSVARAAELCVVEQRPHVGPGSDTSTPLSTVRVEHGPRLRGGRAMPAGTGVSYLVTPARGSSVAAIGAKAEELAAGLHVGRVVVERVRPDLGRLDVIWRVAA